MTTFIQLVALAILITFIILVVKWQVDDDIKKMEKRLDDARKEINKKAKVINKEITKGILLKAGFVDAGGNAFKLFIEGGYIILQYIPQPFGRCWRCSVDNNNDMSTTNIQTIDHFNMLMELMDIDFRLKEE